MSIADFLLADIADIEAAARRVKSGEPIEGLTAAEVFGARGLMFPIDRVLAKCEADRQIVAEHGPETEDSGWNTTATYCRVCRYDDGLDRDIYPCRTLRLLALPCVDRPDYREEWKP